LPTETVLALCLTLVSSVAINWGYLLEHRAASLLPPLSAGRPLQTAQLLLGSRAWLVGFGLAEGVAGTWYAMGLWLAASVVAAVLAMTVGARPMPGGAAFGLAAGILFAAGDIATKAVVSGGSHLILVPTLIGFYAGGTMVLQSGFQHGKPLTTAGIATLATNAIPIAAAMTLFREPLPSGVLGVVRVAAFASVVVGAVFLAPKRPAQSAATT
jgi:hypothetical protein